MAKLLDWIFGRHYDSSTPSTMPPVWPTRDTQPITPTAASKTDDLQPLKNWCHPFKDTRDPLQQLTLLANATSGYYPLGVNGLWHGGVHFDSGTAAGLKQQSSVHCLADGEVVAYRIDRESPEDDLLRPQDHRQQTLLAQLCTGPPSPAAADDPQQHGQATEPDLLQPVHAPAGLGEV
ncbi:hypothetical protein [Pseudomonas umsongensis]|uniref:hypothetical protein n=1 Tax=Pseudomonas umsongensis TaxID=198618 RepID=UPI0019817C61|nr:hypothetical protein [Pseudomonas umsongensis]